jgi:hypothetical protein
MSSAFEEEVMLQLDAIQKHLTEIEKHLGVPQDAPVEPVPVEKKTRRKKPFIDPIEPVLFYCNSGPVHRNDLVYGWDSMPDVGNKKAQSYIVGRASHLALGGRILVLSESKYVNQRATSPDNIWAHGVHK